MAAFLIMSTLGGCLQDSPTTEWQSLKVDTQFVYHFTSRMDDPHLVRDGTFGISLLCTGQAAPETTESPYREAAYQMTYDVTVENQTTPERESKNLTLSRASLALLAATYPFAALGVDHELVSNMPSFSSSGGILFDFLMFPTAESLIELLGSRNKADVSFTHALGNYSLDVRRTASQMTISGTSSRGGVLEAIAWQASYSTNHAVPTSFVVTVASSNTLRAIEQPPEAFVVEAYLESYVTGDAAVFHQSYPPAGAPNPTTSETIQPWDQLVTADLPYSLRAAANDMRRNSPRIATFIAENEITFPAFLNYRSIYSNGRTMQFEWNLTFCNEASRCESAVVFESEYLGGEREPNIITATTAMTSDPDSGGSFTGKPYSLNEQAALAKLFRSLDPAIVEFGRLNELPIRSLTFNPAGLDVGHGQMAYEAIGGEISVVVSHGSIVNTGAVRPVTSGGTESRSLVHSTFWGPGLSSAQTLQVIGEPPEEWKRETATLLPAGAASRLHALEG